MAEHVRDRTHQHAHHRFIERRELVMHPQSVFPGHHEILPAQIREVPRRRRLRNGEALMNVADADLASCEKPQNSQPRRVCEGFERLFQSG